MQKEVIGYINKNNEIIDTQSYNPTAQNDLKTLYFDNSIHSLNIIRHTCAHLMAQAIKALYPDAEFFVGPNVDEGFYYDFKTKEKITEADLAKIESKMKDIAKKGGPIIKKELTRTQAEERFKGDSLKQAVMKNIKGDELSIYVQESAEGEFEDLCRGPHLPNLKLLQAFKLIKLSGAYLNGDEKEEMLTRIYGIAFADKESLKEHLHMLEEAKKRDHRKLGVELKLFTFDDDIGAGLPIWLPNGSRLRKRLEDLLTKSLLLNGYEPVRGPEILKSEAWTISGHYQNYGENMYFTQIDEVEYGIKPMNCVGHIKVYQSSIRSYKELPLRFYEYGVVHRHEKSGVLHGLLRVREFTQDDAHIFCTPDQIESEVTNILELAKNIMESFGFSYEMQLATKPEKAIGEDSVWEKATEALRIALEKNGIPYEIDEGGGAFYGPKIDIKITDSIKRKWQCGTIQIDMNLPERFNLSYVSSDNKEEQPVMIHRALLGSFERFIGILTEHFGGEFPFFIAPTQVQIIPIGSEQLDYAQKLESELKKLGIYAYVTTKDESLNKKIRTAEKQKIPLLVILGEKEVTEDLLSIRDRTEKNEKGESLQYTLSKKDFLEKIVKLNSEVTF
ncbi:threonine--tRNA ligase [Helicobacter sp. 13S00401-1]|uniref:threonine--tRNA ligase n=1 Tax=Helicobacter sp. 13S00401-1 TaxID=1905758 RepID=UPI000BA577EA|nr:threonine--tRNA ligase [Helicobacter sp. 13S00401-1]PAF50184.1 threonine--tRNA ligase [Helicobacter sp. 13S00401-1]